LRQSELFMIARFAARRVLAGVAILVLVSVLIFGLIDLLPGDAALLQSTRSMMQSGTPAQVAAIRHQFGLDRPASVRYWEWFSGLLHGDLGNSLLAQRPVTAIIGDRLGNTLTLGTVTLAIAVPLALLLGILAGTREGRRLDHAITGASLGLVAIPEFVLAAVLIVVFTFALGLLPAVSILPAGESPLAHPQILVLPVATLATGIAAYGARFVRAGVADVMRSRYVEMARLNGVPERRVVLRHVLPNALAPSVQVLAAVTGVLVGGAVLVETIFAYPGLGATLSSAVAQQDAPVVEGLGMLIATVLVAAYTIADLVLILLIPKLRTTA
jgi:peptide/nickel transport system permease protein